MMKINQLSTLFRQRLENDKDLVVGITGEEGAGKSCLALGLALKTDIAFDLDRNIMYSPTVEEATEKIYSLPRYSAVCADEAIKIMYKLNWGTKLSKYLNVIYAICRKQNLLTILCMPRFTDFTEYFRNHRIKIWLHVFDPISNKKKKGLAAMMVKTWNPLTSDPWGVEQAQKIAITKGRELSTVDNYGKISFFKKLHSFIGIVEFEWIEGPVWKKYLELKEKNSIPDDLLEEGSDGKETEKWRRRTFKAIEVFKQQGYSYTDIARLFGVNNQTILSWMGKQPKLKKVASDSGQ